MRAPSGEDRVRRPRLLTYLLVAVVGVAGVALMWDRMPATPPQTAAIPAPLPVVSVEAGRSVGDDVSVLGPDGLTYGPPSARWESSGTIRVSLEVSAPRQEGIVEILPPKVAFVRAGQVISPNAPPGPRAQSPGTRVRGGGPAGFAWHFDPDAGGPELGPGDLVTVRVLTPDGFSFDVEDLEIGRPLGRGLSR